MHGNLKRDAGKDGRDRARTEVHCGRAVRLHSRLLRGASLIRNYRPAGCGAKATILVLVPYAAKGPRNSYIRFPGFLLDFSDLFTDLARACLGFLGPPFECAWCAESHSGPVPISQSYFKLLVDLDRETGPEVDSGAQSLVRRARGRL
jgi:hypothetical protein